MKNIMTSVHPDFIDSDEKYARLQQFAESFNHVVRCKKYPIQAWKQNGEWFGYSQIVNVPVIFTAWHTDKNICSPRQVVEAYKQLSGWAKLQHGGGMTTVPNDTTTFLPTVMEKIGLKSLNCQLYEQTME